jgi:hypothetical protein
MNMKKIGFLIVCAFVSLLCFAGDGEVVEVPMTPNSLPNRGQASIPIVDYSTANNTLTVEFESNDSYVLVIEDVQGVTWYSSPLNTSGIPTVYDVNLQPQNTYVIRISSANHSFYGILEL